MVMITLMISFHPKKSNLEYKDLLLYKSRQESMTLTVYLEVLDFMENLPTDKIMFLKNRSL